MPTKEQLEPALEKRRYELAEKHANAERSANPLMDNAAHLNCKLDFCKGFNAAITELESAAGEFDEDAATIAMTEVVHERYRPDLAFRDGARWQFEQDKARIGHAFEIRDSVLKELERQCKKVTELEARLAEANSVNESCHHEIDKLEARLAESEQENAAWKVKNDTLKRQVKASARAAIAFDEKAFEKWWFAERADTDYQMQIRAARWQFKKLKPWINALKSEVQYTQKKLEQAEAQIAALEKLVKEKK
jgi:septal ring factor EnvC (AmiA/AmiB activator)